jgi:hypothetical protein
MKKRMLIGSGLISGRDQETLLGMIDFRVGRNFFRIVRTKITPSRFEFGQKAI